jgi:hypothetical protein
MEVLPTMPAREVTMMRRREEERLDDDDDGYKKMTAKETATLVMQDMKMMDASPDLPVLRWIKTRSSGTMLLIFTDKSRVEPTASASSSSCTSRGISLNMALTTNQELRPSMKKRKNCTGLRKGRIMVGDGDAAWT